MKRIILVIICLISSYVQARDIQANFEIRNHERFPIFVRLIQKGRGVSFRTDEQVSKQSFVPAHIGELTLVNGKTGNAIDSWASGFDWSRPVYIEIVYSKDGPQQTKIFAIPEKRTAYVAFENERLRPQKGKAFSNFTQSGFPLAENVKANEIFPLTQQQVNDLLNSLDIEKDVRIEQLKQLAPSKIEEIEYLDEDDWLNDQRNRVEEIKKFNERIKQLQKKSVSSSSRPNEIEYLDENDWNNEQKRLLE